MSTLPVPQPTQSLSSAANVAWAVTAGLPSQGAQHLVLTEERPESVFAPPLRRHTQRSFVV